MKYIAPTIEVVDYIADTLLIASLLPPVKEGNNNKDDDDLITDADDIGAKPGTGIWWWGNLWQNIDDPDED